MTYCRLFFIPCLQLKYKNINIQLLHVTIQSDIVVFVTMPLMMTVVIKQLRVFLEHDVRIPIYVPFQSCATRAPVVEQRMR